MLEGGEYGGGDSHESGDETGELTLPALCLLRNRLLDLRTGGGDFPSESTDFRALLSFFKTVRSSAALVLED